MFNDKAVVILSYKLGSIYTLNNKYILINGSRGITVIELATSLVGKLEGTFKIHLNGFGSQSGHLRKHSFYILITSCPIEWDVLAFLGIMPFSSEFSVSSDKIILTFYGNCKVLQITFYLNGFEQHKITIFFIFTREIEDVGVKSSSAILREAEGLISLLGHLNNIENKLQEVQVISYLAGAIRPEKDNLQKMLKALKPRLINLNRNSSLSELKAFEGDLIKLEEACIKFLKRKE